MIKDAEQGKRILAEIELFLKELEELIGLVNEGNYLEFDQRGRDMLEKMEKMHEEMVILEEEEPCLAAPIMCECILESLKHVLNLAIARSPRTVEKIRFEVIPLTEELYAHFYFRGCVHGDSAKTKQYLSVDKPKFYRNKYLEKAKETGIYKYELSIIVVACNKLEVTRQCIEHVFKYVPKDLSYELILINHGSTDGTKEYFESVSPTKQLDLSKNGGGMHAVHRIVEGRYQLIISNDVLITENAITNMLTCIKSDEKIRWVVPTTPNVSNLQSIEATYSNIEELYEFAHRNNVSNPDKWEQRARLCDPIAMSEDVWDILSHNNCFDNWLGFSFPDDRTSLALRRSGHKMMLVKDAYCYHYGSLTLKKEIDEYKDKDGTSGGQAFYVKGRQKFYEECGIDPWGTGFCWSFELIGLLPCNVTEHADVLGINCGIGSNPLKIKEYIKELVHNRDVTLCNVTDDTRYLLDLKGVSDQVEYVSNLKKLSKTLGEKRFDYIVFEDRLEQYKSPCSMIENIIKYHLKETGIFAFCLNTDHYKQEIARKYPHFKNIGNWYALTSKDIQ